MSWKFLLGTGLVTAGSYYYVGGFHDINIRTGELPFDKLDVWYKPHARGFDVMFLDIQNQYVEAKRYCDPQNPRYLGVFHDDPSKMRELYGNDAYIRYAVGFVPGEGGDGAAGRLEEAAADGFRASTVVGGKCIMADFPVRDHRFWRVMNKYLMSRRVYPRMRMRQAMRGIQYTGAMEYYHDNMVTVAFPLDRGLTDAWMFDGVEEARPPGAAVPSGERSTATP